MKEQNARLKLQLHYERNEGKRVIQTKIKSGNPISDKDGKDPPTPLTPPTDRVHRTVRFDRTVRTIYIKRTVRTPTSSF